MSEEKATDVAPEEKSVFDEAEISEELPTEGEQAPDVADEEETGEFTPTLSKEAPKDKLARLGEKKKANGSVVTIEKVFFTRPRTQGQDGAPIPPKQTQAGDKEFYPGKLGVKFAEDNLVEYYPNFHYFVNDGTVSKLAKINRTGENMVSTIFKLAVAKMGKPVDEVSDAEFFEWLVGKKVKLETKSGTYMNKPWFRNDIVEFVD